MLPLVVQALVELGSAQQALSQGVAQGVVGMAALTERTHNMQGSVNSSLALQIQVGLARGRTGTWAHGVHEVHEAHGHMGA